MKKTYINPEMNIVQLDFTQQILSGSSIDVNSSDGAVNAGEAASRGFNFTDDFEEE